MFSLIIGTRSVRCFNKDQEVSRCRTRSKSEESTARERQSMEVRESTLALKPRADPKITKRLFL